ncbi:hypothetical protein FRC03_000235, partial [Tulasnella sp. 419]
MLNQKLYDEAQKYIKELTDFIEKETWLDHAQVLRFNGLWATYLEHKEKYRNLHPGKQLFRRSEHRRLLRSSIDRLKVILVEYENFRTDRILKLRQQEELRREEHTQAVRGIRGELEELSNDVGSESVSTESSDISSFRQAMLRRQEGVDRAASVPTESSVGEAGSWDGLSLSTATLSSSAESNTPRSQTSLVEQGVSVYHGAIDTGSFDSFYSAM